MEKKKLLTALLVCTAISLPVTTHAAEQIYYEGTYEGVLKPSQNGGVGFINTGESAIVKAGTQFINNEAKRGAGIYNYVGGNLTIEDNVKFDNNRAAGAAGGAIQNFGTAVMGNNLIFENNQATWGGAAIYAGSNSSAGHSTTIGSGAIFRNNTLTDSASYGGAIFVEDDNNSGNAVFTLGKNSTFDSNSAMQGGAIYFKQGTITAAIGEEARFENNTAVQLGGAIYTGTALGLQNVTFNNNSASQGGAIYNLADKVDITGSTFNGNSADWGGGIAHATSGILNVTGSTFESNTATVQGGGIVSFRHNTNKDSIVLNIDNTTFKGNEAGAEGGAVWSGSQTSIINSTFDSNKTTGTTLSEVPNYKTDDEGGGAVFVGSNSLTTINNSSFTNNQSGTVGGAIATRSNAKNDGTTSLDITSSTFDGNNAVVKGGAVATYIDAAITDTSFSNNTSGEKGGAIWANQNLTVNAVDSDVVFSGNSASEGSDIYMNTANTTLSLNAAENKSITLADGISGNTSGYNMLVNSNSGTGTLVINSAIQNATIEVQNGTFHLAQGSALNNSTLLMKSGTTLNTIDNAISAFDNNVTLEANTNLAVDVHIGTGEADNFADATVNNSVVISDVNPIGVTTNTDNATVNLADALGISSENLTIAGALLNETKTIVTPIRYLQGHVSDDGMFTISPAGSGYKSFNPSVMASPVAAQLGGYLTQLNSYDEAFRNMDMYMLMTKKQRQALKLRNKYAAADSHLIFDPTNTPYEQTSAWTRPYATFENVRLKNGPKVSNVAYGSFFGAESELYDLGSGWDGMWGVYAGYNGSHQSYDGISIYQNGGTLGLVGMAYKGNFFTGLTVNTGANAGEASTMYGNDNFSMLMAGIASKTGYNVELADGKFIIQPSFLMSYSFVNTFDYTNAAGVKIKSDPLNAIQIEPGIKFIGNLPNGWQPYLGVSMVWNIMDKTDFTANDVSLPELSVKPYVRYGLGVRKTWGERLVGFFQCYLTGGGRNGVGLQAGFRWSLGKDHKKSQPSASTTPDIPKTVIKLSSLK